MRFECADNMRGGGTVMVENGSSTTTNVVDTLVPPEVMINPPEIEIDCVPLAPSMSRTQKHEENSEEVKCEDDIDVKGGEPSTETKLDVTHECEVDKKRLWCYEHECAVKCSKVSNKKWQYSKTKMKYMYVTTYVKKYVCLSKCGRQVQQMVTDTTVGMQTTPVTNDLRENCGTSNNDYSGAVDNRFSDKD